MDSQASIQKKRAEAGPTAASIEQANNHVSAIIGYDRFRTRLNPTHAAMEPTRATGQNTTPPVSHPGNVQSQLFRQPQSDLDQMEYSEGPRRVIEIRSNERQARQQRMHPEPRLQAVAPANPMISTGGLSSACPTHGTPATHVGTAVGSHSVPVSVPSEVATVSTQMHPNSATGAPSPAETYHSPGGAQFLNLHLQALEQQRQRYLQSLTPTNPYAPTPANHPTRDGQVPSRSTNDVLRNAPVQNVGPSIPSRPQALSAVGTDAGQSEAAAPRSSVSKIPFDLRLLFNEVDEKRRDAEQRGHQVDIGRLKLLESAVRKDDWEYLIISQLHVLHDLMPVALPQQAKRLPPDAFTPLNKLFCDNTSASHSLLSWSTSFPAPIMDIYSDDNLRDAYHRQLSGILDFLPKLRDRWQSFQDHSVQYKTIPLIEDIIEQLHVTSPIMQESLCRMMAILIYRGYPVTNEGLRHVMHIHSQNARTHSRGVVLPEERRSQIYNGMRQLHTEWTLYAKWIVDQQRTAPAGRYLPAFQPSPGILAQCDPAIVPQLQQPALQASVPSQATSIAQSSPQAVPTQELRPHLFPRRSAPAQPIPATPNTIAIALHQAHLRSPVLKPSPVHDSLGPFYRVVDGFVLPSTRLTMSPQQQVTFTLNASDAAMLTKSTASEDPGGRRIRAVKPGSLLLRLRCAQVSITGPSDAHWVTSAATWPQDLSFRLNDFILELRRKLHHGRNLPVDVTEFAQPGENQLKILTNTLFREDVSRSGANSYIGIDRIKIMSHEQVLQAVTNVDKSDALIAIQNVLNGVAETSPPTDPTASSNDEMTIVTSTMTIDLFDPISGSAICRTPVRGRSCRHPNCFDLDTFLASATRHPLDQTILPDAWRCPICRGDVRPQTMIRDGFLDHVREVLVAREAPQTKKIEVEADGSWKGVDEISDAAQGPSSTPDQSRSRTPRASAARAPEVIVLDDDDD